MIKNVKKDIKKYAQFKNGERSHELFFHFLMSIEKI